jgi:hypothetical protein
MSLPEDVLEKLNALAEQVLELREVWWLPERFVNRTSGCGGGGSTHDGHPLMDGNWRLARDPPRMKICAPRLTPEASITADAGRPL